jgi:hypothetical protein
MKNRAKLLGYFLVSLVMVACSASYNWREIRNDEQNFVALFPAKTSAEQQIIRYQNNDLTMTMVAAMADDALFAVGTIPVDPQKIDGNELIDWMKINTAKLIQGEAPPSSIQSEVKTAQNPPEKIIGSGLNLKGLGPDGHYRIYWVRWVIRKNASGNQLIYQLSVIMPFKKEPTASEQEKAIEQFETFMGGFHPY